MLGFFLSTPNDNSMASKYDLLFIIFKHGHLTRFAAKIKNNT